MTPSSVIHTAHSVLGDKISALKFTENVSKELSVNGSWVQIPQDVIHKKCPCFSWVSSYKTYWLIGTCHCGIDIAV